MTILIKGMKLPKKGYKDLRIYANGSWSAYAETIPYNEFHGVAVEVPTPHGRLIDADVLLMDANKLRYLWGEGWLITVENIEAAPTVIEAEK